MTVIYLSGPKTILDVCGKGRFRGSVEDGYETQSGPFRHDLPDLGVSNPEIPYPPTPHHEHVYRSNKGRMCIRG